MTRSILLFGSTLLLALPTGRAFWAWLGENPEDFSGPAFIEFYQVLARELTLPIAIMGGASVVFLGMSAIAFRKNRIVHRCLLIACGCSLAAAGISIIFHFPINAQLASWEPLVLPDNYLETMGHWYYWNTWRLVFLLIALSATVTAIILPDRETPRRGNS